MEDGSAMAISAATMAEHYSGNGAGDGGGHDHDHGEGGSGEVSIQNLIDDPHAATRHMTLVGPPNARAAVWKHFGYEADQQGTVIDKTKVYCKICATAMTNSGNTTNITRHLTTIHPEVWGRDKEIDTMSVGERKSVSSRLRDDKMMRSITRHIEEHSNPIIKEMTRDLIPLPGARSGIWNHFGFEPDERGEPEDTSLVMCRVCGQSLTYSGNTTNLMKHLQTLHPNVPMRPLSPSMERISTTYKHQSYNGAISSSDDSDSDTEESHDRSNGGILNAGDLLEQPNINFNSDSKKRRQSQDDYYSQQNGGVGSAKKARVLTADDLTREMAAFLVRDFRPLSLIYSTGFRSFLRVLAPDYEIPKESIMKGYVNKEVKKQFKRFISRTGHPSLE